MPPGSRNSWDDDDPDSLLGVLPTNPGLQCCGELVGIHPVPLPLDSDGNPMMDKWTVVTRGEPCPYCDKALAELQGRGFHPKVFTAWRDSPLRDFIKAIGFNSVPQIWHGSQHIGGYEHLKVYLENTPGGT